MTTTGRSSKSKTEEQKSDLTPMDVDTDQEEQEKQDNNAVKGSTSSTVAESPSHPDWKDLPCDVIIYILDFTVMPLHRFLKNIFFSVPAANHQQTMLAYNANVNTSVGPGLKVQHHYQPGNTSVPIQPFGANMATMTLSFSSNLNVAGGTFGPWCQTDRNARLMQAPTKFLIRELYGVFKQAENERKNELGDQNASDEQKEKTAAETEDRETAVESKDGGRKRTRSMAGVEDNDAGSHKRTSTLGKQIIGRDHTKHRRKPVFLWKNIDLGIVSNYFQDHEPLSVDQVQVLCHNLIGCRYINLRGHCNFNDDCMETLIARNPNLEFLDARVTELDHNGLRFMMQQKNGQYAKDLKTLKLSWCSRTQFTDTNLHIFALAQKLTHLDIINNGLRSSGVQSLLRHCKGLTNLNLSHNPIEDESCKYLVQAIHLKKLIVRECEISNLGAHTLICNDDDSDHLTEDVAKAAGMAAEKLPEINALHRSKDRYQLLSLDLSNNTQIKDQGISNLRTNTTLVKIALNDTGITDDGVMNYLSKNTTLRSVSLDFVAISNRALESMLIAPNTDSSGEAGSRLSTAVQNMPQLKEVSMRNTHVTKEIYPTLKNHFGTDHQWKLRIYLT